MPPKKKGKSDAAAAAPKVNIEEVMQRITQLALEIVNLKQDIDDRAKDHADSLSQYDVSYPLSSLCLFNEVLYSGSLDKEIVGIDTKTRNRVFKVQAADPVYCLFIMESAGVLFAGTVSKIEAWNATSSEPYGEFHGHEDRVNCLREYEGDLLSGSNDGTLRRWARKTQRCLNMYPVCEYPLSAFEVLDDLAYCATWDNSVRCVDLKSGDTKGVYRGHDHVIQSIALMSSEKMNGMDAQVLDARNVRGLMYTGSMDHKILGWEMQDDDPELFEKKSLIAYKGHTDAVFALSVLDVPDFVAQLTGENELAEDADPAQASSSHGIPEHDLAALRDKEMPTRILIAGSDDRSVRLFDCNTGMCMLVLIGHTDGVSDLVVHKNILYSASFDRTIRSWDLREALVRIQMRRKLKTLEDEKHTLEGVLEENGKKKTKKANKKKK